LIAVELHDIEPVTCISSESEVYLWVFLRYRYLA